MQLFLRLVPYFSLSLHQVSVILTDFKFVQNFLRTSGTLNPTHSLTLRNQAVFIHVWCRLIYSYTCSEKHESTELMKPVFMCPIDCQQFYADGWLLACLTAVVVYLCVCGRNGEHVFTCAMIISQVFARQLPLYITHTVHVSVLLSTATEYSIQYR